MSTFIDIIESNFLKMGRVYLDSIHLIRNAKAFAYQDESKKFFVAISSEFVGLVELFSRKQKDDEFYKEIRANDSNTAYLNQLDCVMDRQYKFITTHLKNATSMFFYEREEFDDQVKILIATFDSIVTDANLNKLLTRDKEEIDEIYKMSEVDENYPQIPYYLLQEQIAEHDRLIYEEFGILPEHKTVSERLGHRNFISAIEACYVWIFNNLEARIKFYIPDYTVKLHNLNEALENCDNHIVLKTHLNNDKHFKRVLYEFLKTKYIECEYEDFKQLFVNCKIKITWKGSLVDLVLIFKGTDLHAFTDPNYTVLKALTKCFSSKGRELKYGSLKSIHSRCLNEVNKSKYDRIIAFLKKYQS